MRSWDPATWEMRWWLPLAGLAAAAGVWMEGPGPGGAPTVEAAPVVPAPPLPSCADPEDGYARAGCNAR
jgi:hypothetical protein